MKSYRNFQISRSRYIKPLSQQPLFVCLYKYGYIPKVPLFAPTFHYEKNVSLPHGVSTVFLQPALSMNFLRLRFSFDPEFRFAFSLFILYLFFHPFSPSRSFAFNLQFCLQCTIRTSSSRRDLLPSRRGLLMQTNRHSSRSSSSPSKQGTILNNFSNSSNHNNNCPNNLCSSLSLNLLTRLRDSTNRNCSNRHFSLRRNSSPRLRLAL